MTPFKTIRVILLLLVLFAAAFYSKTQRLKSRAWIEPLNVVIYPINGENSSAIQQYIDTLNPSTFSEIDEFFHREADYYNLNTAVPFKVTLGPVLHKLPPPSPNLDAGFAAIAWWGLKFRYWAYRHTPDDESNLRRIRVFALYHEARPNKKLHHSLGLDKGLLAIVHVFAADHQEAQNNIVIAHELLHTVGASDKYTLDNDPIYPAGYADPDQQPLYPQSSAEIMAGRIPLSSSHSKMAEDLEQCMIGKKTAVEINWIQMENGV